MYAVRISITTKNLMFAGWPECRVVIPLHSISSVEKTNSLMIIPNALLLKVESGEEYFFGSFMERELCYSLLTSMVEVSKGLQEFAVPEEDLKLRKERSDDTLSKTICEIDALSAELSKDNVENESAKNNVDDDISSDGHDNQITEYERIFKQDGVVHMHTQDIPVKSKHVFTHFWRKGSGFR